MRKILSVSFLILISLSSCQKQSSQMQNVSSEVLLGQHKVSLDLLPEWTNQYNEPAEYRTAYDIEKLMSVFGFTRLQAVQFQSCIKYDVVYSGRRAAQSADLTRCANQAKSLSKKPIDADRVSKSKFTIVFDLDETLYDQYHASEKCHDIKFVRSDGKTKYIQIAPFATQLIKNINSVGGTSVIFSANVDATTRENLKNWPIDNSNYLETPLIAGQFFNSHLTLYPKTASPGVVLNDSKDLRVIEENLSKTIIVDDNPVRLFQPKNHRLLKKFFAPQYCSGNNVMKSAFDKQLEDIWGEIKETLAYMEKEKNVSFTQAYLPYSMMGQVTLNWIRKAEPTLTEQKAKEFIRRNPSSVDAKF